MMEAIKTLELDFASPEKTIKEIVATGTALVDMLAPATTELGRAEVELEKSESDVAMQIRNSGLKVTEGYVSSAVDGDGNVVALRNKVEGLAGKVAGIKAAIDNLDRAYGLFKTWMLGQRPVGIGE